MYAQEILDVSDLAYLCSSESETDKVISEPAGLTNLQDRSRCKRLWKSCRVRTDKMDDNCQKGGTPLIVQEVSQADRDQNIRYFRDHYNFLPATNMLPDNQTYDLIIEDMNEGHLRTIDLSAIRHVGQKRANLQSKKLKDGSTLVYSEDRVETGILERFNALRVMMYTYVLASLSNTMWSCSLDLGSALSYAERYQLFATKTIENTHERVCSKILADRELKTRSHVYKAANTIGPEKTVNLGDQIIHAVEACREDWIWTTSDIKESRKPERRRPVVLKPANLKRRRIESWNWSDDSNWSSDASTHSDIHRISDTIESHTNSVKIRKIDDYTDPTKRDPLVTDNCTIRKTLVDPMKNEHFQFNGPLRKKNFTVPYKIPGDLEMADFQLPPPSSSIAHASARHKNLVWRPLHALPDTEPLVTKCWHWIKIAKEVDWGNHDAIPLLKGQQWPFPLNAEDRLGKNIFESDFTKPTPSGFKPSRHRFKEGLDTRIATGRQPSGVVRPPLVPRHLDKETYMREALRICHPMIKGPEFDPELKTAIAVSATSDESLNEMRSKRIYIMRQMADALSGERATWATNLPGTLALVRHIHIPLQWALLSAMDYSDIFFAYDHTHGKTLAGRSSHSFLWHRKDRIPSRNIESLWEDWKRLNEKTIREIVPNKDEQCNIKGFQKTMKEFEIGHMQGPFEIEDIPLDRFVITRRKCIQQGFDATGNPKYRNVDDFTASEINATAEAAESYIPDGFETAIATLCEYSDNSPDPTKLEMEGYVADYATAFRQDPVRPDQQNLVVIGFWNPTLHRVQAGIMRGHPFGAALSPQNFARIPEAMCFIARKLFFLPISHYSDDNYCFEKKLVVHSGWSAWRDLNEIIGWILGEAGEEKFPFPSDIMRLLGTKLSFAPGIITISIDPDKIENISNYIQTILDTNHLGPGCAGQLGGKLQFVSNAFSGQFGKHFLRPLISRQYQSHKYSTKLNSCLEKSLKWWKKMLTFHPPRPLPLKRTNRPRLVVFGDGEGSGSIGAIAFFFPPGKLTPSRPKAFQLDLPQALRDSWGHAKQKINQIEAVVPLICLLTFKDWTHDSMYCHYVDSTSALSTLVRGSSRTLSMSSIADTTWNIIAHQRCFTWFEYVPTRANLSDGISRRDFSDPWSLNWELVVPTLPLDWRHFFAQDAPVSYEKEKSAPGP